MQAIGRLKVPRRITEYIGSLYDGACTRIRVDNQLSGRIKVERGVRQGDPLSPILFNAVIDWVMSGVDSRFRGPKVGNHTVTYLAFADDIVLAGRVASRHAGHGRHRLQRALTRRSGDKRQQVCLFAYLYRRKAKRWICDPDRYLTAGGSILPSLSIHSTYKYLGTGIGAVGASSTAKEKLSVGLDNLSRAPLKPQQRVYFLTAHPLPSLHHQLTFAEVSSGVLKEFDIRIRKPARLWLRLPPDTPTPYFHADVKDGGLGIVSLQYLIPVLRKRRLERLEVSSDPVVQTLLAESQYIRQMRSHLNPPRGPTGQRAQTTTEVRGQMAQRLHTSVDGVGLRHHTQVPSVNRWVQSGTRLLSGTLHQRHPGKREPGGHQDSSGTLAPTRISWCGGVRCVSPARDLATYSSVPQNVLREAGAAQPDTRCGASLCPAAWMASS